MGDTVQTVEQLRAEVTALRQQVAHLVRATAVPQPMGAALREGERRLRDFIDGSIQGVLIHRDFAPLFVNQAFAELYGYETPDDILRLDSILWLMVPEERKRIVRDCEAQQRGEPARRRFECQSLRRDGSTFWVETRATEVAWEGLPATQLTVIDITERKQAEAALVTRLEQLEAIRVVTTEITRELNLTTLLGLLIKRAAALTTVAAGGIIFLWDDTAQMLVPQAWDGGIDDWIPQARLKLGEGLIGTVALRRQGLRVDDYKHSPYAHPRFTRYVQDTAIVAEPLVYHDRLVGVIGLGSTSRGRPFTAQDHELLALFAAQAAIAIENARLYAVAEQRHRAAESLVDVGRFLAQSLHPAEVGRRIVDSVQPLLNAVHAVLYQLEPTSEQLLPLAFAGDETTLLFKALPATTGAVGFAIQQRLPVASDNILTDARFTYPSEIRARLEQAVFHAALAVPLLIQERVFGVLAIRDRAGRVFTAEEQQLAQTFADQAALTLDNARLFAEARAHTAKLVETNASLQAEIAERQRMEAALRQSEVRYRDLVHGSIQGILIHQDFVIQFANPALARIFGYDCPETLIGQDFRTLSSPQEHARLAAYSTARLQGNAAPSRYETQGVRQDGTLIWLECLASCVMWGGTPAVMATLLEITERKRLETQLRQAQKMEAIGTLAGGIAHDFNNMLAAMRGYTELALLEVAAGSRLRSNLQEALVAQERATDLVRQILTFSRHTEHERQPVDLTRVLTEVRHMLRASLPSTIEIRHHLTTSNTTVLADPIHMHQVLMNLCTNAEHAMRETGGLLELCLDIVEVGERSAVRHAALSPGPYVRLTVRDTGHGMPPATLERIFEPFFTTKAPGEGTGMGLAVVHGIVTSTGGSVTATSTPGYGTTFTVYLRHLARLLDVTSPPHEPLPLPQGKERVLFVDDEESLVRVAHIMLKRLRYQVSVSTSGAEALAIFQGAPERFDVVMTDQTMPHMTGEKLAGELRRIRPDIPIILCTGFSHNMTSEKAQALGIDALCMKPLALRDFGEVIQRVLGRRSG